MELYSRKKEIKSFSGLLYHIARNHIIDVYRARSAHKIVTTDDPLFADQELHDGGIWEKNLETKLEHQYIVEALKKLKHEYREVITLRFIDGLKMEEIVAITGKKSLAIRVTLHRALKKLKDILKQSSL
jgi:RNA polymerase sigma-70 factor (ECF subfamily)